jgi:hypothetical protein
LSSTVKSEVSIPDARDTVSAAFISDSSAGKDDLKLLKPLVEGPHRSISA